MERDCQESLSLSHYNQSTQSVCMTVTVHLPSAAHWSEIRGTDVTLICSNDWGVCRIETELFMYKYQLNCHHNNDPFLKMQLESVSFNFHSFMWTTINTIGQLLILCPYFVFQWWSDDSITKWILKRLWNVTFSYSCWALSHHTAPAYMFQLVH